MPPPRDVNKDGVIDLVAVTGRDTISVYLGTNAAVSALTLFASVARPTVSAAIALYGNSFDTAPGAPITIRNGTEVLGTLSRSGAGGSVFELPRSLLSELQGLPPPSLWLHRLSIRRAHRLRQACSYTFDFTPNRPLFLTHVVAPSQVQLEVYSLFDGILQRAPDVSGWEAFIRSRQGGSSLVDLAKASWTRPNSHCASVIRTG